MICEKLELKMEINLLVLMGVRILLTPQGVADHNYDS